MSIIGIISRQRVDSVETGKFIIGDVNTRCSIGDAAFIFLYSRCFYERTSLQWGCYSSIVSE